MTPGGIDTGKVLRLFDALAGPGIYAGPGDIIAAQAVEAAFPGAGSRLRAARRFHSAAAEQAVTRDGIRGVIFGAAQYCGGEPRHKRAALASAGARFAYVSDPDATLLIEGTLRMEGNPVYLAGRVGFAVASLRDPQGLAQAPAVAGLPEPWHLAVAVAVQFWAPSLVREVLAGYAKWLPGRSTIALSWPVPPRQAPRDGMPGLPRLYRHDPRDVERWLADAGLWLLRPGIADVRCWLREPYGTGGGTRIAVAVAQVPG